MKKVIGCLFDQMTAFERDLKKLKLLYIPETDPDDRVIFRELLKLIQKYPSNPKVMLEMILFLNQCRDQNLASQFSDSDIEAILQKSCKLFENDVDLNVENFTFINDKDMDHKKAHSYLKKFRKRVVGDLTSRMDLCKYLYL